MAVNTQAMISVEEARQLIVKHSFTLPAIPIAISDSLNYVLAEDVISPIPYPPFDQSAMDGFAVRADDCPNQDCLEIVGESSAGMPYAGSLVAGQAVRIFTGAKVPARTDTVVVQEKTSVNNEKLTVLEDFPGRGSNIRSEGSQVKRGDVILYRGQVVNAGTVGLLASLGIVSVAVFPSPRITLVVSGNELSEPGSPLRDGQVYESNSYCIRAALASVNCTQVNIVKVKDDERQTIEKIGSALNSSDLVLATGGISVGKYDFVGKAMEQSGVENIFYKIAQKPGKPLFLGKRNRCLIFGLPGNPAAALSCFYEYVLMAIRTMQGRPDIHLQRLTVPVTAEIQKKEGLALYLRGMMLNDVLQVFEGRESSDISSFSSANCLVYIPPQKGRISANESVEIHLLP